MATSRASGRPPARAPVQRSSARGRVLLVAGLAAVVVLAAVGLGAMLNGNSGGSATVEDALPSAPETVRAAGVVVEQPSVDLGTVPLNQFASHTFTLRNTGDAPVSLGQARTEILEGC